MSTPHWSDTENLGPWAWDSLWLGEQLLAGLWRVKGTSSRDVEEVKVKGKDGIRLRDNGSNATKLTLIGKIWYKEAWEEFQRQLPTFDPEKPGVTRTPLSIYGAIPDLMGVRSVYVKQVDIDPPETGAGFMTVTISATKWFPQVKDTSTKQDSAKGFDGAERDEFEFEDFQLAQAPSNSTEDQL
jgi:hypothetical protein